MSWKKNISISVMTIDLAAKPHSGGGGTMYDFVVCDGFGSHTGPNQPIENVFFPITAVETVASFAKVAFQMLIRKPSVSSPNDVFGITDDPMGPSVSYVPSTMQSYSAESEGSSSIRCISATETPTSSMAMRSSPIFGVPSS